MLAPIVPDAASHLLVASVISLPATMAMARILAPEDSAATAGKINAPSVHGPFDALSQGTKQGLELFWNVVAGLSTMAPGRRGDIASLGLRTLVGGTLANCTTAAIVGLLI